MSMVFRMSIALAVSLLAATMFAADPPAAETDGPVLQRATERLSLPPETIVEQPALPTRNFGPTVVAKPQVTVAVTADPFFTGVGFGPYPFAGFYGGYYRPYYVPPIYRYGYYYHRPWYYGYYARYPYFLRAPYVYPSAPPAAYIYGPPAVYPHPGAYVW
ncbi:MAG: hypothetical protein HY000_36950 [Planctomycetes bacterium]|nr:hypothetical protein [Planctomycetota bacterium]